MFNYIVNIIKYILGRDVMLVVKDNKRYYVLHCDAYVHWYRKNWYDLIGHDTPYTFSRAKALVVAHNKQRKSNTAYGVRETYISFNS